MKTATVTLRGLAPYSQSRYYEKEVPMETRATGTKTEDRQAYEERTWRYRLHRDQDGYVFVPPMSIKNAISEAAKYLSVQIPGKGKSTYTKHFEAGVMAFEPGRFVPPIKADAVAGEWLHVPSDGRRGGTKRVMRCFPVIPAGWVLETTLYVLDDVITEPVFEQHLRDAGNFIGIGRFRPRNNGFYGRFAVEDITWATK